MDNVGIAWLNGKWQAIEDTLVPVLDRGFMFGDGVYEVIPVYRGKVFTCDEHLARLRRSLGEIRIKPPWPDDTWRALFQEAIERGAEQDAILYVQVTRGVAGKRDHAYPKVEPTVLITVSPPPDHQEIRPYSVVTRQDIRWTRGDIKVISLVANCLLKDEALAEGCDDAILIRDGKVTEATSSNIFIVKDGVIATAPANNLLLHGITRALVIELARENNLSLQEREVTEEELIEADEVWLTSTTHEVWPIGKVDEHWIGNGAPGPVYQTMHRLYQQKKEA